MSTWGYRLIRHRDPGGDYLALHEAFYDDEDKLEGFTEEPITFISSYNGEGEEWARDDLIGSLERALRHLRERPEILDYTQLDD